MVAATASVPQAVEALKAGAADFLVKPFDGEEIAFIVKKALAKTESQFEPPPPPSGDTGCCSVTHRR
jgi:two-component system response regulator AtoC